MICSMEDGIRTADEELEEARTLTHAGMPALALPILGRLAAFDPDNDEIREAWISAHVDLRRYQKVLEIADAAIARGRERPRFEFWRAVAYDGLKDPERAEACARAALAAEPSYSAAIVLLSLLLANKNRHAEALELCQRTAAEYPENYEVAEQAIALALEMELHGVVVDSARAYLRRFGRNAAVLKHLGSAYLELKEFRKADRAFRDAATLEPHVAEHHCNVMLLAILTGDMAGAEAYLGRLAARDEQLADAVAAAVDQVLSEEEDATREDT